MEKFMFNEFVHECKEVSEATSYLEILNYSEPSRNSCEEHPLTLDEFDNFLYRRGAFAPPDNLGWNTKLISGLRLVVQMNAKHNETFTPKHISLPKDKYASMVQAFKLPLKGIETTSVVGPFFWSAFDGTKKDPYLHIIHRKSDVRKKGKTRGWELMLSHSFKTGITSGYIKGTPSSDVVDAIAMLHSCTAEIGHPMLLPVIVLSRDLSPKNDQKQREARDWLRRLEKAVSLRDEVDEAEMDPANSDNLLFEVDGLSRDLVECHGHVLWKRPQAYAALCKEMHSAMTQFKSRWGDPSVDEERRSAAEKEEMRVVEQLHESLLSRIDFYVVKLKGLENYIHTTLERLKVQREALYNILSQREARLNLEIAGEQRRIAHASKRDSTAMKTLSLLGALFLPGTYLASVFGMSFFNYEADASPVSVEIWIYFVITVPITAIIVFLWMWFDRKREAQHKKEDSDLEQDIERMEKDIMAHLRKRTMSKQHTWKSSTQPIKA